MWCVADGARFNKVADVLGLLTHDTTWRERETLQWLWREKYYKYYTNPHIVWCWRSFNLLGSPTPRLEVALFQGRASLANRAINTCLKNRRVLSVPYKSHLGITMRLQCWWGENMRLSRVGPEEKLNLIAAVS